MTTLRGASHSWTVSAWLPWWTASDSRWVLGITGLGLIVRLIFLVTSSHDIADTPKYVEIAGHLLRGEGFSLGDPPTPTVRSAPLYPTLVAFSFFVGGIGNLTPALVAQAVMDTLTAGLVFVLARAAWQLPPLFAAAGAVYYAVNPLQAYISVGAQTEGPFTFLVTFAVTVLAVSLWTRDRASTFASGLILGFASLTRAIGLGFGLLLSVYLLLRSKSQRLLRAGAFLAGISLVLVPWVARNYAATGEFIPIQSFGAVPFYETTFVHLDHQDERKFFAEFFNDPLFRQVNSGELSAACGDRLILAQAMTNVARDPGAYFRSRLRDYPHLFVYGGDFLTGAESTAIGESLRSGDLANVGRKLAYALTFSVVPLLLAVVAALRRRRWNDISALVAMFWFYNAAFNLIGWIEPRAYAPSVPFLAAWASAGAYDVWALAGAARGLRALARPRSEP